MGDRGLRAIEAAFSEAAMHPARWSAALDVVAAEFDAFGALLIPVHSDYRAGVLFSTRMEPSFHSYFQAGSNLRKQRKGPAASMSPESGADDLGIFSFEEIRKIPYYREFLERQRLHWSAGTNVTCNNEEWRLTIQRSDAQNAFSSEDKERLVRISRSLSASLSVARAAGDMTSSGAMDAFDISETAALLLDGAGHVIRANRSAEKLLGDGVSIARGKLVATDGGASKTLDRALQGLLQGAEPVLPAPVALPRDGQRPILVHFLKLTSLSLNPFAECQAIAILVDPERPSVPAEAALRASFGFTPAEARLASHVVTGAALESVANTLGISLQTGRNQLKSIFMKAGVHRQAELVAVISAVAAARGALKQR